jgi:predicted P-loop ATPase
MMNQEKDNEIRSLQKRIEIECSEVATRAESDVTKLKAAFMEQVEKSQSMYRSTISDYSPTPMDKSGEKNNKALGELLINLENER